VNDLTQILTQWQALKLHEVLDFDKFNQYAIVHHSTTIEGSTLTETEAQLLLDEGITPKGKPLVHSLMNIDHLDALKFVIQTAKDRLPVSPAFIQAINARVMRQTGSVYNTALGTIDSTTGAFRKGNVRAGNSYFVNYDKVPGLVEKLCAALNKGLTIEMTPEEMLNLSFDAHSDLVTIHPFYDGNGRTSRLLMNFIQSYFDLPMGIVFKEDKADYFQALVQSREKEDLTIFRQFMMEQYLRFLSKELDQYSRAQSHKGKAGGFSMIF
jgi:Fic family protein